MKRTSLPPEPRAASAPVLRLADFRTSHQTELSDGIPLDDGAAGPSPAPTAPSSHQTELSDGDRQRLTSLLPSPVTPGFDVCSGRCLQLWLALGNGVLVASDFSELVSSAE